MTLAILRAECPGWDLQVLHAEFRAWIGADSTRTPANYQQAFIGFCARLTPRQAYSASLASACVHVSPRETSCFRRPSPHSGWHHCVPEVSGC